MKPYHLHDYSDAERAQRIVNGQGDIDDYVEKQDVTHDEDVWLGLPSGEHTNRGAY